MSSSKRSSSPSLITTRIKIAVSLAVATTMNFAVFYLSCDNDKIVYDTNYKYKTVRPS